MGLKDEEILRLKDKLRKERAYRRLLESEREIDEAPWKG